MRDTGPGVAADELKDLIEQRAVHRDEVLQLSGGSKSSFYIDCKPVTLSARGARLVAAAFLAALDRFPEQPGAVGGLAIGADPIVSAMVVMSSATGQPLDGFYVRKEPKPHGLRRIIENPPAPGTRVVIVDDVVTSGGSILRAVRAARSADCDVVGVIALVDRGEGGRERITQEVGRFESIYDKDDLAMA